MEMEGEIVKCFEKGLLFVKKRYSQPSHVNPAMNLLKSNNMNRTRLIISN